MTHIYHAIDNVVYDEEGTVMCVVAPIMFLNWVAAEMAEMIADSMNEYEYDSRDILRGSILH